jgi:hypothetical protein
MLDKILQLLRLSCPHKKLSHPFAAASTVVHNPRSDWDSVAASVPAANAGAHYIVCLDCGRKFNYDWQKMRVVK